LATIDPPATNKGLRAWIGAYKHIKACIPGYSTLFADLESMVAGKESREHFTWSDSLIAKFHAAQNVLKNPKSITIPKPSDHLIITSDGFVSSSGVGSILYIMWNGKMHLGEYYSAKFKPHKIKWLPCEVEALAISSAINHWGSYISENLETKLRC
jgi:hypothetical protein